jgi:hypothetical protein
MSFWPKLILHLYRPLCNAPNMMIIKACGLCSQWYHCFDIVVTLCLHTYHLTCFGTHLKTNKCKVCNQILHLDWWCSQGFKKLDEFIFADQEMGLKE